MNPSSDQHFQLRYRSLSHADRGFAFPCDDHGQVDLDALSERAGNNYLYARAWSATSWQFPLWNRLGCSKCPWLAPGQARLRRSA